MLFAQHPGMMKMGAMYSKVVSLADRLAVHFLKSLSDGSCDAREMMKMRCTATCQVAACRALSAT